MKGIYWYRVLLASLIENDKLVFTFIIHKCPLIVDTKVAILVIIRL